MNKRFLICIHAAFMAIFFSLCMAGCDKFLLFEDLGQEAVPSINDTSDSREPENGGDKGENTENAGNAGENTENAENAGENTENAGNTGSGTQPSPPQYPSIPHNRVWYVSSSGSNNNSGTESASPLASVQSALTKIRTAYRSGKWPAGESAVIIIEGRIIAHGSLGSKETMIEIAGTGNYPPIVLQGDPVTGGILDVNRKKGEDGQVLLITNNKVTLGEHLTLTGGNQLWGGAVRIGEHGFESAGEFIMAGGEISGNTGASGGAVMIYKGSMTMTGGVIKNNRNDYFQYGGSGGGIYVNDHAAFTMTGGLIETNGGDPKAERGGGIYINGDGTATMSGGEIRGNTSIIEGGGVYIAPYGVFNMSGGLITGNKSGEGGGVQPSKWGGTFNQTGGTVTGNTP